MDWMGKVSKGVEKLPKIPIVWVGCTNVTDRRQTDGRTTTYSEREHEFTFAKTVPHLAAWTKSVMNTNGSLSLMGRFVRNHPTVILLLTIAHTGSDLGMGLYSLTRKFSNFSSGNGQKCIWPPSPKTKYLDAPLPGRGIPYKSK